MWWVIFNSKRNIFIKLFNLRYNSFIFYIKIIILRFIQLLFKSWVTLNLISHISNNIIKRIILLSQIIVICEGYRLLYKFFVSLYICKQCFYLILLRKLVFYSFLHKILHRFISHHYFLKWLLFFLFWS